MGLFGKGRKAKTENDMAASGDTTGTATVEKRRPLTQKERCLKMLKEAGSGGVKNYVFAAAGILRYDGYIDELRKHDGCNILTERVELPNGRMSNVWKYILIGE